MAGFRWPVRIRFVDTDASRRIHYTAMFRYFEAAEFEFLRAIDFLYPDVDAGGVVYPRVHVECDYLAHIRFEDLIEIEVGVERVGSTSATYVFTAWLDDRPAAKGKIVIVAVDTANGKPCLLPADFAAKLREFLI